MFLSTRNLFFIIFILIVSSVTSSCEKEKETTGTIKVVINRGDLDGVNYSVYTEAFLSATTYVPPVKTGTIYGKEIFIRGLNVGNYILDLNADHNWRIFMQVTPGHERTFSID